MMENKKVNKIKIGIVLGTRPEIIKMSPIIRECIKRHADFFILHTNQHYSENLDKIFFQELELPKPKYNLNIGSGSHAQEIGKMIIGIEGALLREKPDVILVEGDTNTVLAGAVVASKLNIKVGHIEAGLRSHDRSMPEEINRILVDHCSDYLFAPTKNAGQTLIKEGIKKPKIFITGNTIVDAVYQNIKIADKRANILEKARLKVGKYFLVTFHRQENVDEKEKLVGIIGGLKRISETFNLPIICPVHPRTKKMIEKFGLVLPKEITMIDPLGYFEFLQLEKSAKLILTDSGGVQEEACILRVPCVTLRENTERPETIKIGSNMLAGTDPESIFNAVKKMLKMTKSWKNVFGNIGSGEKIINTIINYDEGEPK